MVKKGKPQKNKVVRSGDVIRVNNTGDGTAIAAGSGASASVINNPVTLSLTAWTNQIYKEIDLLAEVSRAEKNDMKQQIDKIGEEAQKGQKAELGRLEKLINTLNVMSSDIFDVVVATLANPLAGIGLVIKKIGDKAKIEPNSSKS